MKKYFRLYLALIVALFLVSCDYTVEIKDAKGSESLQSGQPQKSELIVNDEPQSIKATLPEYPQMTAEMQAYFNKYFPQGTLYAAPLGEDFDEAHYMSINRLEAVFRYAYGLDTGDFNYLGSAADSMQPNYPAELVESTIQKFYLYDTATLRADSSYHAAESAYHFAGGYGGGYWEPIIVSARQNGDLLELDMEQYGDTYTGGSGFLLESSCTLTIRLDADGGWKYLANKVTYQYGD